VTFARSLPGRSVPGASYTAACHHRSVLRAPVIVALLIATAHADPRSTTLKMRHTDGTNLHMADQAGAIHWNADITVKVELRDDHKLVAAVTGTRGEHNLYARGSGPQYNTDEEMKLGIRWTGTWTRSADKLQLALVLADDTCTRIKTSDRFPTETLTCKPAAKRTQLACTTLAIELEDPSSCAKRKVDAWSCAPASPGDLGESPSWLLGKTTCIETTGAHMGRSSFHKC
jgi:hypothetical protein